MKLVPHMPGLGKRIRIDGLTLKSDSLRVKFDEPGPVLMQVWYDPGSAYQLAVSSGAPSAILTLIQYGDPPSAQPKNLRTSFRAPCVGYCRQLYGSDFELVLDRGVTVTPFDINVRFNPDTVLEESPEKEYLICFGGTSGVLDIPEYSSSVTMLDSPNNGAAGNNFIAFLDTSGNYLDTVDLFSWPHGVPIPIPRRATQYEVLRGTARGVGGTAATAFQDITAQWNIGR